jgi:hypothetical protein
MYRPLFLTAVLTIATTAAAYNGPPSQPTPHTSTHVQGTDGLRREFTMSASLYAQAALRAQKFMHVCHGGPHNFSTIKNSYNYSSSEGGTALTQGMDGHGKSLENISVKQVGNDTQVTIEAFHLTLKQEGKELDAAERSIEKDTQSCR